MRVAVCGLGRMGSVFAENLLAAGHNVTVWNRTPRPDVARGASVADTAADAAEAADVVVVMVYDGPASAAVLGALVDARPGTLVINASTIAPAESIGLAERAQAAGLRYVEAPVLGSVPAARAGTLTVLAGGTAADVAAAGPVVAAWSHAGTCRHTGPVGTATGLKLVANLTLGVAAAGLRDALRLGAELGLDREDVLETLAGGAFGKLVAGKRDRLAMDSYDNADFTIGALSKDLALAASADLPVAMAASRLAADAVRRGHGEDDMSVLGASQL